MTECMAFACRNRRPRPGLDRVLISPIHNSAAESASLVVGAVGVESVRRMLDVGGGSGGYSIAFAQANPALRVDILDLATVEPIARRHIQEAGVADRVQVRAGDLRCGRLGEEYDLAFVSAICHMLSPGRISTCCVAVARRWHPAAAWSFRTSSWSGQDGSPLRRVVRAQHAGGNARRQQLQRTKVCRLARRGGFLRRSGTAPAGNYRAHDRLAAGHNIPFRRLSRDFRGIVGSPVAEAGEVGYECQKRLSP